MRLVSEGLVAERTRITARLRWYLHTRPRVDTADKMDRASAFTRIQAHVVHDGTSGRPGQQARRPSPPADGRG
ncbi:MAG: hypothetical protein ACREQ3_25310, partial [Candidatus Binatia bacterium]